MDIKPLGGPSVPTPKEVAPVPAQASGQQQAANGQQSANANTANANTANANTANANTTNANGIGGQRTQQGFISPILSVDQSTGAAVLSFRNQATGTQLFQVPSRKALVYEHQQAITPPHAHGKITA